MAAPPIRVVSLARTPDRLASFRADNPDLQDWSVFPAVDGAEVDAATRDALGDTALWSPGGVGAALSHIALWRACVENGAPLTVCEDDAVLRGDFLEASARLLDGVPHFDVVLWGWNFDAICEAEVAPGVGAALLADEPSLRAQVDAFRGHRAPVTLLRLRKALGMPCYSVSPKGAAALLAGATPVGPARLALPLMPHEIGNVTFDVTVAGLYPRLSAHLAVPPLAATRNDWSRSTIRLPQALNPPAALAEARALETKGRSAEAVAVLQSAAAAWPGTYDLWEQLGQGLAIQGHLAAAAAALEHALPLAREKAVGLYNLARVRLLQGRPQPALDLLDEAAALAAGFALAHCNRGAALSALGRGEEAEAAFGTAVGLQPDLVEAHRGLAGARLARLDLAGAAEAQQAALRLRPNDEALAAALADTRLRLADAAASRGDLAQAARLAAKAAEAPTRRLQALITSAHLLERLGRFEESRRAAEAAVSLAPASALALVNLGVAHLRLGHPHEAERAYRAAIREAPDFAGAHHGLGFALLKQGRWRKAWPEYDGRLVIPAAADWSRSFGQPPWDGGARPSARLLLACEQGYGDTIQAACLIAELRARVGAVVVQAPSPLLRLLRRVPGVDEAADDAGPRPAFDIWLPLMSLPGRLDLSPDRRPPETPALTADPELAAMWRRRLPEAAVRVGVIWQGNPEARVEHGRSFPLAALQPLAILPDVTLISLQKGFGREQLAAAPPEFAGTIDLGPAYQDGDFEDTAAVLAALDLVVCCDTAVAHLAGALGRPVWIALGDNPDWRWPADRDDTPWYASARLWRRRAAEPWPQLFARMAEEIGRRALAP